MKCVIFSGVVHAARERLPSKWHTTKLSSPLQRNYENKLFRSVCMGRFDLIDFNHSQKQTNIKNEKKHQKFNYIYTHTHLKFVECKYAVHTHTCTHTKKTVRISFDLIMLMLHDADIRCSLLCLCLCVHRPCFWSIFNSTYVTYILVWSMNSNVTPSPLQ